MSEIRKGGKQSSPITPAEACELLQSALAYMQQAGYVVRAGNRGGDLIIVVPGAEVIATDAGTVIRPCQQVDIQ